MVCPESYKSAIMAIDNRPQANTDSVRVMFFCAVFGLARPASGSGDSSFICANHPVRQFSRLYINP